MIIPHVGAMSVHSLRPFAHGSPNLYLSNLFLRVLPFMACVNDLLMYMFQCFTFPHP